MSGVITARETVPSPTRALRRQGTKRLALAAAALAIVAGGAWYGQDWWTTGRFIETTNDAYVGGNITALAPHVSGFVSQVLVQDNQQVHAGELLIRLDRSDFQVALDHAEAEVAGKRAALDSLRARDVMQQATIRQQRAQLDEKTALADFEQEEAIRYGILARTSAGSRQDAQRTRSLDQEAHSAVVGAEAGLEAARQQLKVLQAEIAAAEAAEAQARSDLRTARLNLGYTEIRAPIDGYVGNRAAQVGAYANQGAYLISVTPTTGLWVDANFKEDQIGRMTRGESATVVADVISGHIFHGRVASLTPGTGAVFSIIPPENATGNFTKIVQRVPVRVLLDPADPSLSLLRPGLSTTVSVDTRPHRDVRS